MAVKTRHERDMEEAGDEAAKDMHEAIKEAMKYRKISIGDLANKMGTSTINVSQMLDSESRNLSIKAIGRIFSVLDMNIYVWVQPPSKENS